MERDISGRIMDEGAMEMRLVAYETDEGTKYKVDFYRLWTWYGTTKCETFEDALELYTSGMMEENHAEAL